MTTKTKKENEPVKKSPFKKRTLNLPFHNFETEKEFTGIFEEKMLLGEKPEEGNEDKRFSANVFTDLSTGEQKFITDSYSVAKAIDETKQNYAPDTKIVLHITFKEKSISKGKPFNIFDIESCSLQEYEDSL